MASVTRCIERLPEFSRSLSRITFFFSSGLRPDPRRMMYACSCSMVSLRLNNLLHRTSVLAKKLSLVSSAFCTDSNNAFSASSYCFCSGIRPHCPPSNSISRWTDFSSPVNNSDWCSCSFWKALPSHPRINLVTSSVNLAFGHAARTSSTFCWYTVMSSDAGLNVGTKDAS